MTMLSDNVHELYLDLVKRCLLNMVHDPRCAAMSKSIFLADGTHEKLLLELLSTPPDRENFFAWVREQVDIVLKHGTQEQIARIDAEGITALSQSSSGTLKPAVLKEVIRGLQEVAQESLASVARRYYLTITEGEEAASLVTVNSLSEAFWKWRNLGEVTRRETDVTAMADFNSLGNTQNCVETVLRDGVPGDFLEAGVWKGAQCILARAVLKTRGITDRRVYVADSFEGLPIVDEEVYPLDAAHRALDFVKGQDHYAVSDQHVLRNFSRFGLLDDQVVVLKGWFSDTLPDCPAENVAVLRIDGDYYESNMDVLEALYDRVPPRGFVIIDDYGLKGIGGYLAVDRFRQKRGILDEMVQIAPGSPVHYWRKS